MKYKGEWFQASVEGNDMIWDGRSISPARFAAEIAGTNRNAWRDLYIKRPSDRSWILADAVRKQIEVDRESVNSVDVAN
jgi:hypothetical protein